MAQIIWALPALNQLDEIAGYIALDNPEAAQKVVQRIFNLTDKLSQFPEMGSGIPELSHQDYRQLWCKPCWIYYKLDKDKIYILHVRRAEKLFGAEDLMIEE